MRSPYELSEKEFESLLLAAEKKYDSRISCYMLRRSLAVISNYLENYHRVFALRADLRFAQSHVPGEPDLPLCFQKDDEKAITRALESLKSQLREEHKRSDRTDEPTPLGYIWVRERVTGEHHHHHLVLLFDREAYAYLGNYTKVDADNMGARIQKAWCSATGLDYPDYTYLPHFPKNHSSWFTRDDALTLSDDYYDFLLLVAYLTKYNTKDLSDGYRNFGTSQIQD
ncbi:inovirus Gp2 family protein [Salmonella enterica]|uniref:inovirus Gp2 family protein n=1 Tax=Salmonella enterica TaxID=28901 RepID=UPI0003EB5745|nr:inovirus Gp2 family protein [Salmonella enterica]EKP6364220.1 inovirus Gp2 family protein [Salmonella enterica subsp. diarizonae]HCA3616474.1 inovirus Gp2 family protein [Salmonella enterica subsp. diarizonae serovar 61:i:z]EAR0003365.1 inovirus Gp2 family protein [Salmonella enterica]EAT2562342.1 inovirus Gp2 family protein [Salmonella enterica]EAW0464639.1 inovirus Gp2 family protein [Salmonella enterica]